MSDSQLMNSVPAEVQGVSAGWRRALLSLVLVVVAILLLYRDTAIAMVGIWYRSDTFAHAFLVAPISGWLIWRRRHDLLALRPRPQPWVLPLIALAAVAWLLGDLVAVNAVTQFALVTMLVLSVPALVGVAVARRILFPLVFLYFCVPVGEFLLPVLMEATADFTIAALQLTGIPVYREGLQFIIPSGSWSVVEACSGVRYLIASLMVGALFGYLNYASNRKRFIFAAFSLVVPIVANWLRAYMIVMIGHLSDNKLASGVDHLIYGWVFFGIVITTMFLVGSRWSDSDDNPAAAAAPAALNDASPGSAAVAFALVTMLILPPAALALLDRQDANAGLPSLRLPDVLSGNRSAADRSFPGWKPRFLGAAAEATRIYAVGDREVGVHVSYYRAQSYEKKLVSSQNVMVLSNSEDWHRVRSGRRTLAVDGVPVTLLSAEFLGKAPIRVGSRPALNVLQVYWVNGQLTASEHWAKVLGALGRLTGRGDDGAAIFLYTVGDAETADWPTLDAFAQASLKPLTALLQQTRSERGSH